MSEQSPQKKASPGWYPHPSMAKTRRYWDGQAWTDQIAPIEAPPAAASTGPSTGKIAGGVAVGVILAAIVIGTVVAIANSNDDLDCATENANRAAAGQPALDCD